MKFENLNNGDGKRAVDVVSTATLRRRNFLASFDPDTIHRRLIKKEDIPEIVDALGSGGISRNTSSFTRARFRRIDHLVKSLDEQGSVGMAAWDGSVLVGFLELYPLQSHPLARLYQDRGAILINNAYFHESYGVGVRSMLLSDMIETGIWPRLPGKMKPSQLVSLLQPATDDGEVGFHIDNGFKETAVTNGFLKGYRVFALPRQQDVFKKRILKTTFTGLEADVLYIPVNPLCHLSMWTAERLRTVAGQMGINTEVRDFLNGWEIPAPVVIFRGKPVIDLNRLSIDETQLSDTLARALDDDVI